MAFTGTATITMPSDRVCRITGLSLIAAATGTIGLFGGAAEIDLPEAFQPTPYSRPGVAPAGGTIDLAESIRVSIVIAGAAPFPVSVTKVAAPFAATLTNTSGASASGPMEIWVESMV